MFSVIQAVQCHQQYREREIIVVSHPSAWASHLKGFDLQGNSIFKDM